MELNISHQVGKSVTNCDTCNKFLIQIITNEVNHIYHNNCDKYYLQF